MQEEYEIIGDIRGPGLFIRIELVKNKEMVLLAPKHNLYLGPSMPILTATGKLRRRNVIKIKPPLVVTEEDTDFILENFEMTLKDALNKLK